MKCVDRAELAEYAAGRCLPARAGEIAAHLSGCAACRSMAGRLAFSARAAASCGPEPSPADFTARLMARIAAEKAAARRTEYSSRRLTAPVWGLVFACAAAFLLVFAPLRVRENGAMASREAERHIELPSDGPATPSALFGEGRGGVTRDVPLADALPGSRYSDDGCRTAGCGL